MLKTTRLDRDPDVSFSRLDCRASAAASSTCPKICTGASMQPERWQTAESVHGDRSEFIWCLKNKDFRHVPRDRRNRRGRVLRCCDPWPEPKRDSLRRFVRGTCLPQYLAGAIRFERSVAPEGGKPGIGRRCGESEVKSDQWETANKNNSLRLRLDHGCVLFVQHPSKNALQQPLLSGSFIACAGSFGNCDDATEGGIPRSSRS